MEESATSEIQNTEQRDIIIEESKNQKKEKKVKKKKKPISSYGSNMLSGAEVGGGISHTYNHPPAASYWHTSSKRQLELEAYAAIVTAFRAQGELTWKKESTLHDLRIILKVSDDRHKMEIKRTEETLAHANLLFGTNR
jgi:hypothetical protein